MKRILRAALAPLLLIPVILAPSSNAVTPQVAGGASIQISDAPWQVLLSIRNTELCGGSFLSGSWVLTAAHCLDDGATPTDVAVFSNVSRISDRTSDSKLKVSRVVVHPEWNPATQLNDLALVQLATPVSAAPGRQPIALPTAENPATWPAAGTQANFVGWGAVSDGGPSNDQLQRGTISILTPPGVSACGSYGGNFNALAQICAGVPGGGIDACQGDSGGGLTVATAAGTVLAGVVSTGYGCALPDYPGVYARVTSYLPWIQSQIGLTGMTPSAPQGLKVAASGPGQLTVSWQPPAVTGGSPITKYTVKTKPGNAQCSTTGTTCTLKKLKGSRFTLTVNAENALGSGASQTATVRVK